MAYGPNLLLSVVSFPFASGVTKSEKFSDLPPPSGFRRPRNN
jgi:hypothetical protein